MRARPSIPVIVESLEGRRLLSVATSAVTAADEPETSPILTQLTKKPTLDVSTVPANGDVNPYGVAFVPGGFASGGPLKAGDVLVSNFNNSTNAQGTGSTIVSISPSGKRTTFFAGPKGLGLTTALGVLRGGFVLVGNVPTTNGNADTVKQGSLLILDRHGKVVETLRNSKLLDGPWDLTVRDMGVFAQVFVSNVLSGTVTRIDLEVPSDGDLPRVMDMMQIGSSYVHHTDPAALVVGPTGLAYDAKNDRLYVASTGDNAIFAITDAADRTSDAGKGSLIYKDNKHLRGPLGLVLTPGGDLITTNGDAVNPNANDGSEIIEFTVSGKFVSERPVDNSGMQGGAFGIALSSDGDTFAAVDDINNTLEIWDLP